jgi:hypothetical protein
MGECERTAGLACIMPPLRDGATLNDRNGSLARDFSVAFSRDAQAREMEWPIVSDAHGLNLFVWEKCARAPSAGQTVAPRPSRRRASPRTVPTPI